MEIWKTLRVSHIPTPPAATTDKCLTRRYTNTPLGTKDRSGHRRIAICSGGSNVFLHCRRHTLPSLEPLFRNQVPWQSSYVLPSECQVDPRYLVMPPRSVLATSDHPFVFS